jgi:hypothetical protein
MNAYLAAQDAFVTVAVPEDATEYHWRLVDQDELALIPESELTAVTGDPELTIEIPADKNTLTAGAVRALRMVEVFFSSPTGVRKVTVEYVIEAEHTLVVNVNTFQTYGEAVLGGYELFSLPGWAGATKIDRAAALVAARRNISQLRFRYVFDAYQDRIENTFGVSDLTMIAKSTWDALPADFKEALKRAQIIEADYLLTGGDNAVDAKRRMGIISETVGESSMFLRAARPLEQAVCKRAMKELSKYIVNRVRITRS